MRSRGIVLALSLSTVLLALGSVPAQATGTGLDAKVPSFTHVFVIVGENTQLSQLNMGNAPYLLGTLKPESAWLTNYWATTHYSEANYVAMTSGQFTQCEQKDGKTTACHQANQDNLFRQLYVATHTFTTWSESMPAPCYLFNTGGDSTLNHYAAKHNPQLFFDNVEGTNPPSTTDLSGTFVNSNNQGGTFCQDTNIATGGTGPNDMSVFNCSLSASACQNGTITPSPISDFNLVVPNECEDGHSNCKPAGNPITQFDNFLSNEVPQIQNYIQHNGGLLIVTFDEGVTSSPVRSVKFGNGGNVAWLAWGPQVTPQVYTDGPYTHYGFLRTLEDGFGIDTYLGGASLSLPIAQIWGH